MDSPAPLITIDELSDWIRMKPSTIRKWVFQKRIPFVKLGAAVRFRKNDIETWLKFHNYGPGHEFTVGDMNNV